MGSDKELRDEGLIHAKVSENYWANNRGILDIDGNVDAWGLRWRLESGSVVFRVHSSYENYYSKHLVEGEHFIGISPDLTESAERTSILLSSSNSDVRYLEMIATRSKKLTRAIEYATVVSDITAQLTTSSHIFNLSPRFIGIAFLGET